MDKLIYVIILALPSYLIRFSIFGIPFTLLEVLILLSFIVFLIFYFKKIRLGWWKWPLALFLTAGIVGTILSPDLTAALGLLKAYIVEPMLFFIMFINIRPDLKIVVYCLAITATFISAVALIQYATGYGIPAPWNDRAGDFRVTSVYEYPNAVGLILAPICVLVMGWVFYIKQKSFFLAAAFILSILAMVFAQVDGAYLAVLIAAFFMGLFTKWRNIFIILFILALAASLFLAPSRDILTFQDTSGEVRLALWEGTWNMFKAQPFQGAGLAGFPDAYARYKLNRHVELLLYPHNIFMNFWAELGLLGLAWLIWVLIKLFKTGFTDRSKNNVVLMAVFISILIYGLVDVPYFKNDLAVLFWTWLGLFTLINLKSFKLNNDWLKKQ